MPTSHLYQINEIMELIVLTDPKSILDIEVGFGKYGFLSREYLEIWGKVEYATWERRIDGIEAFRGYLTPVHNFIYDHIYEGDANDVMGSLQSSYDLILLIDVLEHFRYEGGVMLLEMCGRVGRNMIIATPKDIGSQRSSVNPYEDHRFQWAKKHFDKFPNKFFVRNPESLICFIGNDARTVRTAFRRLRTKTTVKTYFPFLRTPYRTIRQLLGNASNRGSEVT